ncbi:MAG TPA: UDP-3-O-(3-hydroxymyristoyl)glucosamine N-acyltransferase [Gemmataceae bacterium]|nr:UDP-3-O-(3-hydroxymyristoyl)glucosamine N-acyltransferase [Gemmataceae bacterium]
MATTLRQLAEWVQGEVIGDSTIAIENARALADAGAGDITLAADDKHLLQFHHHPATAAIASIYAMPNGKPLIRVADPLLAFARVVQQLQGSQERADPGIHPSASIHPSAHLGADVVVEAFAVVGRNSMIGRGAHLRAGVVVGANCRIGEEVRLHPHVVLYDNSILGNRVIIHANSVIGADGFGYQQRDGRHEKVPQLGHVEIGDDVEIGACSTIDRGTFAATQVGAGTKIDNLVQIAHNCRIGRHNLFVSQAGIAGSSSTGDGVIVAGQAGIVDHVQIGAGAIIGAQAGVTKDVPEKQAMLGSPATPMREQKRILMSLEQLPEMRRRLRCLEKMLGVANAEGSTNGNGTGHSGSRE